MDLHLKVSDAALYANHQPAHPGDAGIDLFFLEDVTFEPRCIGKTIGFGVQVQAFAFHQNDWIPSGVLLTARSGIKHTPIRLSNGIGIIDRDYDGEIKASFDNISDVAYTVTRGTRLIQLCSPTLLPLSVRYVDELSHEGSRQAQGFGSSGGILEKEKLKC